jgi:predicted AAA+ superfamily ATPase
MQSPKHYLVDPALAARLLGVTNQNGLTHSAIGSLFENLVALSLRVFAPFATLNHLRTQNGRQEVDFVLQRQDGKVVLIEVKWGPHVRDEDLLALTKLRDQLGDLVIDTMVITTGPVAYRTKSGVLIAPLALLG